MDNLIDLFIKLFTSISYFLNNGIHHDRNIPYTVLCRCQILLTLLQDISSLMNLDAKEIVENVQAGL